MIWRDYENWCYANSNASLLEKAMNNQFRDTSKMIEFDRILSSEDALNEDINYLVRAHAVISR